MDTSIEGVVGGARNLTPPRAKPVFDAFRAAGVDADLAYTATRSIQGMVTEGAAEMSKRIVERTQAAFDALTVEMRAGFKSFDARFEQQDIRLDNQDRRFDRLEGQMTEHSEALSGLRGEVRELSGRYQSIDDRLGALTQSIDDRLRTLTQSTNDRLGTLTQSTNDRLGTLTQSTNDRLGTLTESISDQIGTLTKVVRWLVALVATVLGIGAMVMVQLFVQGGADRLMGWQPTAIQESVADAPTAASPSGEVASSGEDGQEASAVSPE